MSLQAATLLMRLAGPSDAPAITALIESAYRGEGSRRGWTTEEHLIEGNRTSLAETQHLISDEHSRFIVAYMGDVLAGCALIKLEDGKGYFGMFAVRPDLQSAGLGKQILAFAEAKARELWQCREMIMTVINIRKELVDYYVRRGYRHSGTKPFPFDKEPGARRTDFHFVMLIKDLE